MNDGSWGSLLGLGGVTWESCTWPRLLGAATIVFAVANLKALPFMWHVRVFGSLFKHLVANRSRRISAATHGGGVIFEPVITTTYNPLLDCDFNGHKSNSTFYADLDVSRMQLIAVLFKDVISPPPARKTRPLNADGSAAGLGKLGCLLGGVSCTFRREIKPFQKFEIWTRVLCWDEKWVYIVSHFVRAGAVKPRGYSLKGQGAASMGRRLGRDAKGQDDFSGEKEADQKALFASAISKYVFKSGRRTVRPEVVLLELGLIQQRDENRSGMEGKTEKKGGHADSGDVSGNWAKVEQERLRGMELARQFASLDSLDGTFNGSSAPALGDFGGSFW